MRRMLLPIFLLATSTACTPMPPIANEPPPRMPPKARTTTPFPPQVMRCQPEPGQSFIGQKVTEDVVARVMAATGAGDVRVIKPGMMVTLDFRDDRLNLDVDEHGVIVSVRCG